MSSKLIFLLLTALLLVQCSVGKPMPDADTAAEVSKEEETKKESDAGDAEAALLSILRSNITEVTDMTLNSSKKVIEDVVRDLKAIEEKSEALKIKTDILDEILSIINQIDLKNKKMMWGWKLALLVKMDALRKTFKTTATENPSAGNLIIITNFKKHGRKKILEDVK